MIWLTWRQFRASALAGAVLVAVALAYLVWLGTDIREAYDAYRARCAAGGDCDTAMRQFHSDYSNLLLYLAGLFGLVPVLVGVFWGAPLVARELEAGTHRLVWNQSVSRRRWLTVKVLLLVVYIVLGSLALKRARNAQARWVSYVAALAVFAFIISVARAHQPLGVFGRLF